jgi:phage gp36-like protein
MSTFIIYNDYQTRLSTRILDLLTNDTDYLLDNAENEAKAMITDRLGDRYDLTAEFGKSGSERNNSLIRFAITIAIYVIYSRIPDEQVPERVVKDYDDTVREMELLQKGKLGCSLTRLTDSEGETISRFRMGNNTPRTHDPYQLE